MAAPDPSEQHDVPGIIVSDRSARVTTSALRVSSKARLLPGGEVDVLNISETGLLVEGQGRPVVGTVVSIRLTGSRLKKLEGRIVRSRVSTIHRNGTLSYESAIEFDHSHDLQDLVSAEEDPASSLVDDGGVGLESSTDVYVIDTDNDW